MTAISLLCALVIGSACATPTTMADCSALRSTAKREECRFEMARPLVGDDAALDAALSAVADPGSRDLLLLRLAIHDPLRAGALCRRVETDGAAEKCRQVLGRPHLQTSRQPPRDPP